tara:strand:+ start:31 stop:2844 length:2814 start_codon:yes stop_codon:yes gene_type:complete
MNTSTTPESSVSNSLNRLIVGIGGAAMLLFLIVVYNSTVSTMVSETTNNLTLSLSSHSRGESRQFLLAEDNIQRLRKELLNRLEAYDPLIAEQQFQAHFFQSDDGLWRVRPELDDHTKLPSLYLQHDVEITPSVRVRALVSYGLLKDRGPALVPPYYSVYMDFVEKGLMVYSPHVNWGAGATRQTDNFNYPTMVGSMPENNPNRESFWTPVYFDEEAKTWMVSVIEPLDWRGEWVGTIGHDVAIDELLESTLKNRLPGSYNILVSQDGQLILHPDFQQQIQDSKGDLSLVALGDQTLTRINEFARNAAEFPVVIEDSVNENIYGITKLAGPEWFFVTVYPRRVIEQRVQATLFLPSVIAIMVLLVALFLLRHMAQRLILQPLGFLDSAVEALGKGGGTSRIPIEVDNEFGRLARSFENLSTKLEDREKSLLDAQNDWQRTFNTVPELIVILDPDLFVKQANESFLNAYGLYANGFLGQCRRSLLSDSERTIYEDFYFHLLQSHEVQMFQIYSVELSASLDVTLVPLLSDDKEIQGIVEVTRDVTENRKLEDQLRQSQKMDAIGHLAGGIAHDFNNLLQIIIGYTETIEQARKDAGEDLIAVNQVLGAATKAAALTQQLLAFGRRQIMQAKSENVSAIVGSTLAMIERLIEENVQVRFEKSTEALIVSADANQLEQVILNLCVNSRDAMPDGGELNISVSRALPENIPDTLPENPAGYAHICVRDTGHGIEPHVEENIFEPFFSTKDKDKGTGLGLATAYGIVQQHAGAIKVTSTPGEGAQFCVFLPLLESGLIPQQEEVEPQDIHHGRECVLVAEDDEIIRDMFIMMLTGAGYEVLSAVDGADAMNVYAAHRDKIELLVLDVMMPELSGHRVMKKIRAENPQIPCLFASGYSEDQLDEDLRTQDLTSFITKPFRRQTLLKEVRLLLDHQTSGKSDQN